MGSDGVTFESVFSQRFPVFRLDDLVAQLGLPRPTLLKLDVDGPELATAGYQMRTSIFTNGNAEWSANPAAPPMRIVSCPGRADMLSRAGRAACPYAWR